MPRPVSVADLRRLARRKLPRLVFDYIDGGAEDEVAMANERAALDAVRLVPRVARDVTARETGATLFGRRWAMPFGVAPTGLADLARPGADLLIARAAAAADVPYVLATVASTEIEAIAAAIPGHWWFQLYMPADRAIGADLLARARDAGAGALVVTLDVPAPGKRERDLRNGFSLPLRPTAGTVLDMALHPGWCWRMGRAGAPRFATLAKYAPPRSGAQSLAAFMARQITADLTWEELERLRAGWRGPMLLKGILAAEDVDRAARIGMDAVWLSTHGGRQCDAAVAPIRALPAAVAAAAGRCRVVLDGGIRRGRHIAAALSLGAAFVFAGRPTLYGAAIGPHGPALALTILADEFSRALAMLGCAGVADLAPA